MSGFDKLGKIDERFFDGVIFPHLGASRSEMLEGPRMGLDNGIVRVADGRVMAVTTDPVSYIPELGPEDSAWISLHLLANDLTTSGLSPAYAIFSFNLPAHVSEEQFRRYWQSLDQELKGLGIAVIAGHTGHYGGDGSTIIGSGTLIALGAEQEYLTPAMARPGDKVFLTKSAMVATAGLLARVFSQSIVSAFDEKFLKQAQALLAQYPTAPEAMAALSAGIHDNGATAMHDATEGGVLGALYELAVAAGCGFEVDAGKIPVREDVRAICGLFGLDPLRSLSEGALLICVRPHRAKDLMAALKAKKIECAEIGEILPAEAGRSLISATGRQTLKPPDEDRYWKVYRQAKERGWK